MYYDTPCCTMAVQFPVSEVLLPADTELSAMFHCVSAVYEIYSTRSHERLWLLLYSEFCTFTGCLTKYCGILCNNLQYVGIGIANILRIYRNLLLNNSLHDEDSVFKS